jgi:hypothetical protein
MLDSLNYAYKREIVAGKNLPVVVKLSKICSVTGEPYILTLPLTKYEEYSKLGNVEKFFPELDANQKRFLSQGLTPSEK